jgi:hypothetical protein
MSTTDIGNKENRLREGVAILQPLKLTEEQIYRLNINALHGLRSLESNFLDQVRPDIVSVTSPLVKEGFIVQLPCTFKLVRILNLDTLLAAGTRPIDAALFLNISLNLRTKDFHVKVKLIKPEEMPQPPVNKRQIGMDVFILYLLLLCNCTIPVNDPKYVNYDRQLPFTMLAAFPEYSGVTLGMLADRLSSFDLNKIGHAFWIKKVDTSHYTCPQAQHHLLYTVPTYRWLRCFVEYTIRPDADQDVQQVFQMVKAFISKGFTRDCHPMTKTFAFRKALPYFDQSLYELILLAFRERQLARVRHRQYIPPRTEDTSPENRWRTWTHETFALFQDYIFPRKVNEN